MLFRSVLSVSHRALRSHSRCRCRSSFSLLPRWPWSAPGRCCSPHRSVLPGRHCSEPTPCCSGGLRSICGHPQKKKNNQNQGISKEQSQREEHPDVDRPNRSARLGMTLKSGNLPRPQPGSDRFCHLFRETDNERHEKHQLKDQKQ